MIICGVEIKADWAALAIATMVNGEIAHIQCDVKKLTLEDDRDVHSLLSLKAAIEAFSLHQQISLFVVKSRQSRGKMASGGVTFKIETLFQLSGTPVEFISPQVLSKFSKTNFAGIPESVYNYQIDAFRSAVWKVLKVS